MTDPVFLCDGCPDDPAAVDNTRRLLDKGPGTTVTITGREGFHAVTVKRLGVGETITVTNGHGVAATASVTATTGKDTLVATVTGTKAAEAPGVKITVVQALPKSDRAESPVELATQAGAAAIVPWQADRCIAKWKGAKQDKALAKWRAAAVEAAKQSRRATVPLVTDPVTTGQLADKVARWVDGGTAVVVLDEQATTSLTQLDIWQKLRNKSIHTAHQKPAAGSLPEGPAGGCDVVVIVGPEGGVSDREKHLLEQAGAIPALLGPEVFRTVTAAMAACVAVSVLTGRW